ncbi:hypothetical protein [Bacillus sp. T3]|uniref:hypothetical protein n=1 Tax=Bacillus sp. T3 TaxID=467262 RepID=UPI0029827464|nr:hypothetical protein [Bacillus sp. T3]
MYCKEYWILVNELVTEEEVEEYEEFETKEEAEEYRRSNLHRYGKYMPKRVRITKEFVSD